MAPRLVLDRRTLRLMATAFVLLAALTIHRLWLADAPGDPDVLVFSGQTMGTTFTVRVAGEGLDDALRERLERSTESRLADVDRWMSGWNADSEITRFNEHASSEPFAVSFETAELMSLAIDLGKRSGGAFDVTVGPLVRLWGFGKNARLGAPPSDEEIAELQGHMGARGLRVGRGYRGGRSFLVKASPKTRIDLSAIAKGFGVDWVAGGLVEAGREDWLVEIGGEIRAAGERPGGGPWRVAIERPIEDRRAIEAVVELRDQAMATSGDYRVFYLEGDERISHTIDPRSGRPVVNGPASATAIAETATMADAWATTLMVLGEDGLALAAAEGTAAMLLFRDGEGFRTVQNNLFPETLDPRDRDRDREER